MKNIYIALLSVFISGIMWHPASAAEHNDLSGKWLVTNIRGYGDVGLDRNMYFNFSGGQMISAWDGCNYASFNYVSKEKNQVKLAVGGIATTFLACINGGEILYSEWAKNIRRVNRYEVTSDALYFFDGETRLMSLVKQDGRIAGTQWRVRGFNGGFESGAFMPKIWISLKSDGTVEGDGDCSPLIGIHQLDESNSLVKFLVHSTNIERCSKNPEALRRQNRLVEAINASVAFDKLENRVTFRNALGAMTISAFDERSAK